MIILILRVALPTPDKLTTDLPLITDTSPRKVVDSWHTMDTISMSIDTISVSIDKLTGATNYRTWKIHMKNFLLAKGLWKHVEGENVEPTSESTTGELNEVYHRQKALANAIIISSCTSALVLDLESSTDPRKSWRFLELRFQDSDTLHKYLAYLNWMELSFDGENLQKFSDDFDDGVRGCREAGLDLPEKLCVFRFIEQVNPLFDRFNPMFDRDALLKQMIRRGGSGRPFTLEEVRARYGL